MVKRLAQGTYNQDAGKRYIVIARLKGLSINVFPHNAAIFGLSQLRITSKFNELNI